MSVAGSGFRLGYLSSSIDTSVRYPTHTGYSVTDGTSWLPSWEVRRGASQDPSTYGNPGHSCPPDTQTKPRLPRRGVGPAAAEAAAPQTGSECMAFPRGRRRRPPSNSARRRRVASSGRIHSNGTLLKIVAFARRALSLPSFLTLASMEVDVVVVLSNGINNKKYDLSCTVEYDATRKEQEFR